MKAELNTDELGTVVEQVEEGDTFTVEYHSATSDDMQTKTGEILEVGESWNGKVWELTFKADGEHYEVTAPKDGEAHHLNRIKYDWHNGERSTRTGTHRITSQKVGSEGITGFEIEVEDETETVDVGTEVKLTGDNEHKNLGSTWEVLTRKESGNYILTDERGIDTLEVSPEGLKAL